MIENERSSRLERVVAVGHAMLTAARTAPKGKGVDILECALVTGDDIRRLSESMLELHRLTGRGVYARDGHNILAGSRRATKSLPTYRVPSIAWMWASPSVRRFRLPLIIVWTAVYGFRPVWLPSG